MDRTEPVPGLYAAGFLLNTVGRNPATAAETLYRWSSSNLSTAFSGIVGAVSGTTVQKYSKGLDALLGASLLEDNIYKAAKFLKGFTDTTTVAKTIYNWVGGDKLAKTFWALADGDGLNKGYADTIRVLWDATPLGKSYSTVYNFLTKQLGIATALRVMGELGW